MNKTLDFRFAQARQQLRQALDREGWHLDVFADPAADGPRIFLLDVATGYIQYCQARHETMVKAAVRWTEARGPLWDEVCGACGTLLGSLAKRQSPTTADQADLGMLACLYVAGTQTYATLQAHGDARGSVLVLRYRNAHDGEYWLRPAAKLGAELLTPEQVYAFAEEILQIDRQMHPERFPRASVTAIPRRGDT